MKALITGVNGQDGSYLSQYLIDKKYEVIGLDMQTKAGIEGTLYYQGSICDKVFISDVLLKEKPDEIYNLASVSQVSKSFLIPEETFCVNLNPVINILELMRQHLPKTKLLQATSSEIFGGGKAPFNEESKIDPISPYAVSKEASYRMVKIYRKAYGLFASNAILFNHTSPRHGQEFVIAKIVSGLVKVKKGLISQIVLGNLEIKREWGFAGDYVKAMHMILSHHSSDDFIVGTGNVRTLRSIVDYVLSRLGLSYNESIFIDSSFFRKNDPELIYSDPLKIEKDLGWKADMDFEEVLEMMIKSEMEKE